jgi:hypothetical protein
MHPQFRRASAIFSAAAFVAASAAGCGDEEASDNGGDAARPPETATRAPSRPTSFDTRALEERLRHRFAELDSRERWRVSCPGKVRLKKGGRFTCRVRGSAVLWTITVSQRDGVGRRVRLRGKPKYKNPEGLPGDYTLKATEDLGKRR